MTRSQKRCRKTRTHAEILSMIEHQKPLKKHQREIQISCSAFQMRNTTKPTKPYKNRTKPQILSNETKRNRRPQGHLKTKPDAFRLAVLQYLYLLTGNFRFRSVFPPVSAVSFVVSLANETATKPRTKPAGIDPEKYFLEFYGAGFFLSDSSILLEFYGGGGFSYHKLSNAWKINWHSTVEFGGR